MTITVAAFSARATVVENSLLRISVSRHAVTKSGRRSCNRNPAGLGATVGAAFSTRPPSGIRPTVGWFT